MIVYIRYMEEDMYKETVDLMFNVWASGGGGHTFISAKDKGWSDFKIFWDNTNTIHNHIANQPKDTDIYWTPLVFQDKDSRKAINVKDKQGVLFVDVDELNVNWQGGIKLAPEPSIVWTTSKTRWQGIWLLDDLISLEEQQDTNRRLVYHINADKGAWDAARVLRVPGSINYKRGGIAGKIQKVDFDCTYSLSDFDSIPSVESNNIVFDTKIPEVNKVDKELPLEVKYWISLSEEEYRKNNDIDRSELLFRLSTKLIKNKFTVEETYSVLEGARFNKFKSRPEQLYKEIQKAKSRLEPFPYQDKTNGVF